MAKPSINKTDALIYFMADDGRNFQVGELSDHIPEITLDDHGKYYDVIPAIYQMSELLLDADSTLTRDEAWALDTLITFAVQRLGLKIKE